MMEFFSKRYYHLFNRTNNYQLLFKEDENYFYFLKKFRERFSDTFSVHAYCLMPTHFHFLVRVEVEDATKIANEVGIHLSGYTKAINNSV